MIIKRYDLVKTGARRTQGRRITNASPRNKSVGNLFPSAIEISLVVEIHIPESAKIHRPEGGNCVLVANARVRRPFACRPIKKASILKMRDCAGARGSGESCGRGSAARACAWAAKITDDSTIPRTWTVNNAVRCTESSGMTCSRHWHGGFPWPGSDERANRLDHRVGPLREVQEAAAPSLPGPCRGD